MMYVKTIRHLGLNKSKEIKGRTSAILREKYDRQSTDWENQWNKKIEAENKAEEKANNIQDAEEKTQELTDEINDILNILNTALKKDFSSVWNIKKRLATYNNPKPKRPIKKKSPPPPDLSDPEYHLDTSFLDGIFTSKRDQKIRSIRRRFERDLLDWEEKVFDEEQRHKEAIRGCQVSVKEWENSKKLYNKKQKLMHVKSEVNKKKFEAGDITTIEKHFKSVSNNSTYPKGFPKKIALQYFKETKTIALDYALPNLEAMAKLKEIKYIQTQNKNKEIPLPKTEQNNLYDNVIYQTVIRVIYEIFQTDTAKKVDAAALNGWVETINKGTGKKQNSCILSIVVKKSEMKSINLKNIDPKECFRTLKGVGSSKLHNLIPIAPILTIETADSRFVDGRAIVESVQQSLNLAAMDWEDFEHLVRELFEQEFAQHGGEVKITQASRDRGVDAVAFDPDPIRGGKIVIQAKRYTNTVDVAAVRDLYGTVMNEGANKGILVTTSNYGPDAYEFAKGKPLTLLSGSNLLHLLEKHGTKARIDLAEAKRVLAEEKDN